MRPFNKGLLLVRIYVLNNVYKEKRVNERPIHTEPIFPTKEIPARSYNLLRANSVSIKPTTKKLMISIIVSAYPFQSDIRSLPFSF